jgi:hypothetical protein
MASSEVQNAPIPGLQQAVPYVLSAGSALLSGISVASRFFTSILSIIARSILIFSPLPILLYVFAPIIVFSELVVDVFVRLPFQFTSYLLDAFYPVYVFFGVACITGALLGLFGRLLAKFMVNIAMNVEAVMKEEEEPEAPVIKRQKRTRVKVED